MGIGMDITPLWGPVGRTGMAYTPAIGVRYRMDTPHSFLCASFLVQCPMISSVLAFSPQLHLEYQFFLSRVFFISVYSRFAITPLFRQNEVYEKSTVPYETLKPYMNERIRFGVKLGFHLLTQE